MTLSPPRRQTAREYAPGETIAEKYELKSLLGEGGMGSVWLANNRLLDLPVALKLLRADFDAQDAGKRLLQEARATARLDNPAIVQVFDFGHTEQGDPFIVMELLEGQTLAEILATRGPLGAVEAIRILLPIIDAVAVAHEAGVVHRDLKPANIFVVREQRRTQPKVVDFGIAKMDHGSDPTGGLTRQGEVVGSPGYMSPEQARGESKITLRTDVWALCVVLYECVTGGSPFRGDNYNAWLRAIIEDTVKPTVELGVGDAALWMIIERGLRKSADERWVSVRALGAALAAWLITRHVERDVCGDPLVQYLTAEGTTEAVPSSSSPSSTSSGRAGQSATTVHAIDLLSPGAGADGRPPFPSGAESASAVARTKPPEAPARTSFVLVTAAAVALVGAMVGTIVALGGGAPAHEAAGVNQPPRPHAAAAAAARPTGNPVATVVAEKPPVIVDEPPARVAVPPTPAESPSASRPASPSAKDARLRGAAATSSSRPAPPTPSAAAVHAATPVTPGNAELKDPY